MDFFTKVEISTAKTAISYQSRLAFFGSCFADHISALFASKKFKVLSNPFGTVYNPLSIERTIQNIADRKIFDESDVFKDERCDGLWHCWDAHSSFSAKTKEECIEKLNTATAKALHFLQQADVVFITIGSAFVYSLNGKVVANCHRQDQRMFERKLISVDEAAQAIKRIVHGIRKIKCDKEILRLRTPSSAQDDTQNLTQDSVPHIIFTVSPIRHLGDGAHGNNLSKATVLLAINNALEKIAAEYFPSYEIVMDELRDYRFYDSDMIHLSKTAEEIIFERMLETYCDNTTRENIAKVEKFLKMENHRIQDENSPATQELKKKLAVQAKELEKHIPGFIFSE